MFNRFLSLVFFSFFILIAQAQVNWPAISQTNKPWARWWWEGSAVNKKDLTWNLEQYQKAGLGGLEVTPIYGVLGYENQFIQFLSPAWMQMFDHTLKEAKRLQLGIDLANATGWPFGGPWVTDADASKTVYWKSYIVNGGESLNENIFFFQQGLVRPANNKPVNIDTLRRPITANKDLQSLAIDQIIYPDTLHVRLLMGYSDKGDIIDLTSKVDSRGKLNWTAPHGKWNLFALFVGMHGKMVERAAPGGEGYAIDHFSRDAVQHYFQKFDNAFQRHDISYLRAFFNDSYEVDDARGQANWTPDFLAEFQTRRGYDLRKELPALFQKEDADKNARVIYDYRSTIDELLLEHFTQAWKKWGQSKSALVRNQSHGSPANTLDLYAAVDIPETEGNEVLRFKFASSASNVTGKQLTSSESATWLNEHFLSSLSDVKKAIDLYFLGGVNHIFYHGVAYSPQDAPWPGWLFYAAVHFQPTNPQWKDFHALNEYIARVQSFLQGGRPDNDILLYYPIVDRYSQPGNDLLQHFDGMERNFDGTDFEIVSKWMGENGYSFDFFSDRQLQKFVVNGKQVITGGNPFQVILLPDNKYIPLESLVKLLRLATTGATILCYKSLPQDVPGFGQLGKRRESFNSLLSSLQFQNSGNIKKALIGKGAVLVGQDIGELLKAAGVRQESINSSGLQFIRRRNQNGNLYFIDNRSGKEVNEWVPLQTRAASVALYSAMSMQKGLAKWRKENDGTVSVLLQLQPWESVMVQTFSLPQKGTAYPYLQVIGKPITIDGNWRIEFISGGPTLPAKIQTAELKSWTTMGGEDLRNFSGTAKYTITLYEPPVDTNDWMLDLGELYSTAEVKLDGQTLATLIGPEFKIHIPAAKLRAIDTLEIIVSNLMANRIAYMDRNNLPWKIFYNTNMPARRRENLKNGLFDASAWQPILSGLIGPVTLTPVKIQ